MLKRIYYTVEFEIDNSELTGHKDISVYEVMNNEIQLFFTLDLQIEDNTKEAIQDYLNDNGYGDDVFEIILL